MADGMEGFESMLAAMEALAPIREAMIGFRAALAADGWSESAAEQVAVTFFQETLRKVMRS